MPTLAKNVSHEYDPSIVFHTHSANIPLLHSWIDDLVKLTEKGLPMDVNPNTDGGYDQAHRLCHQKLSPIR